MTSEVEHCGYCANPADGPCVIHRIMIRDKKITPLAYSSLPDGLLIKDAENGEKRVLTSMNLPAQVVYGPLVGILTKAVNTNKKECFAVGSKTEGWLEFWLESDEASNWMKFVRFARSAAEQNMIAYQQEHDVYFSTMREVQPGEELKVWYAHAYGKELGHSPLPKFSGFSRATKNKFKSDAKFICEVCRAAFKTDTLLKLHTKTHKESMQNIPMEVDEIDHNEVLDFEDHQDIVNDPEFDITTCPSCNASFPNSDLLAEHVSQQHQEPTEPSMADLPFKCTKCTKAFQSKRALTMHVNSMHKIDEFGNMRLIECDVCHLKIESGAPFFAHWKEHNKDQGFKCCVCQLEFSHSKPLNRHARETHMKDGYFPCPQCAKNFEKYSSLALHLRTIHVEARYSCPECGIAFKSKSTLKKHAVIHSTTFEHMCPHCGQQFKHENSMTRHIFIVHNPDRAPVQKGRKVKIHDGVTAPRSCRDLSAYLYKCLECEMGFSQKRLYIAHMEARHPGIDLDQLPELRFPTADVEMFKCGGCRKAFFTHQGMVTHSTREHPSVVIPEGPPKTVIRSMYLCRVCDMRLMSANKLVKHIQARHPEVELPAF